MTALRKPEPATLFDCVAASVAAAQLRRWLEEPSRGGEQMKVHMLLARPRRGMWITTWSLLPGLSFNHGSRAYAHALLPGWEYTQVEMRTEMLEDLDLLATTGERPKQATR